MKKIIFCTSALILLSLSAIGEIYASGISGKGKINFTYQRSLDGLFQVVKSNASQPALLPGDAPWNNPDSCDKSDRVVLTPDNPFREDFLNTINTVKINNRSIQFQLSGCVAWNNTTYPIIVGVYLL